MEERQLERGALLQPTVVVPRHRLQPQHAVGVGDNGRCGVPVEARAEAGGELGPCRRREVQEPRADRCDDCGRRVAHATSRVGSGSVGGGAAPESTRANVARYASAIRSAFSCIAGTKIGTRTNVHLFLSPRSPGGVMKTFLWPISQKSGYGGNP